jgi:hypothetical protein
MSRNTVKLSRTLHRDLSRYALAAGAASVSALAITPPAEAQIVYTPAHEIIGCNGTLPIDLNHDGAMDLTIREIPWTLSGSGLFPGNSLQAKPVAGGAIIYSGEPVWAKEMHHGSEIGPSGPLRSKVEVVYEATDFGTYYGGAWTNTTQGYLGIRFRIGRETHYGWVRLEVFSRYKKKCIEALMTGYAYETQPKKPIRAGDTGQNESDAEPSSQLNVPPQPEAKQQSTLGMLALGSTSFSVRPSNHLR